MIETATTILFYCVEAVIVFYYFSNIFEKKTRWRTLITAYTAGYALLLASYFLISSPIVNFLLFTGINILLLLCNYTCRVWSAIFHCGILSIFMFLSEIVIIFLTAFFLKGGKTSDTTFSFVLNATLSKLTFFLLCVLTSHLAVREGLGYRFPLQALWLFALPIATFYLLYAIYLLSVELPIPAQYDLMICIGSVVLMLANIIIFSIYDNLVLNSQKITEARLVSQKKQMDHTYYKTLQEQYNNSRMLIHDIKNHLSAIDILAANGKFERIHQYVESLSKQYQLDDRPPIGGNNLLDVICNQKQQQCRHEGISISFQSQGVTLDFMNDVDICSLMTNLLDNAIEACRISQQKKIWVFFYRKNQNFIVLSVQNCCEKAPKIENHHLVSQKKNAKNHGLGMLSISKSIRPYNGTMDYYYDSEKHIFHTNIVFPISQKKGSENNRKNTFFL